MKKVMYISLCIALLVLLPETLTAIRAAIHNRLQTSINLALGSGLASIGLTIPVVAMTAVATVRAPVVSVAT